MCTYTYPAGATEIRVYTCIYGHYVYIFNMYGPTILRR